MDVKTLISKLRLERDAIDGAIHSIESEGKGIGAGAPLEGTVVPITTEKDTTYMTAQDALTYLPRRSVQSFEGGHSIFDPQRPAEHLYAVILGRVKTTSTVTDGFGTITDIVQSEGLFGESCLVASGEHNLVAVAMDDVSLMAWTRNEIEEQIDRDPRLGLALTQYLVHKCIVLQNRIESMAACKMPERIMLAVVQLASQLGTEKLLDDAVRLKSLTHQTIAEYAGTSREVVTFQMNRLRRLGMVKYNRKHIDVYVNAMRDELGRQHVTIAGAPQDMRRFAVSSY